MRLVTRADFDGLASGILLKEIGIIDDYNFIHPKDLQDGNVEITKNDVLVNVPYVPGCGLWFDHHNSEIDRIGWEFDYKGLSQMEPSCARVIWKYYGGDKTFSKKLESLMTSVDKTDSGMLTIDEIKNPKEWVLINFIMDPRTGLERYTDYRIKHTELIKNLIDYGRFGTAEEILKLPDIKERTDRYFAHEERFRDMLLKHSKVYDNIVVLDLRNNKQIFVGNRFVIYALFPKCNISLRVLWGRNRQNIVITCGHSIINRSSKTNVGRLMLKYLGGGHKKVGTCQVATKIADKILEEIIEEIKEQR
ncbi:Exopolyphosphatase [Candidatus Magnetomoraceae bacterium gMMP-15]